MDPLALVVGLAILVPVPASPQTVPLAGEIRVTVYAEPGHSPLAGALISLFPPLDCGDCLLDLPDNEEDLLAYLKQLAAERGITEQGTRADARPVFTPQPRAVAASTSDANGQTVFHNLQLNQYQISARAVGYIGGLPGRRADLFVGAVLPEAVTHVSIDSAKPTAEVAISLIRLPTVTGYVQDANGSPVSNATIVLQLVTDSSASRIVTRNATSVTNDAGEYMLTAGTPGEFLIGVEKSGADTLRALTLDAGARLTNVDFQLP